jgi:futalosine hydrolase
MDETALMRQDEAMSAPLILVPTRLELSRLEDAGGFPRGLVVEVCGFGPIAAAARTAQLCAQHQPSSILLVGIAGSFDELRWPVGSAASFAAVAIEGIGAGEGATLLGPSALGFPQWPATEGAAAILEELELLPARAGALAPLLLTTCAASGSASQAALRRQRAPRAAAEDMEGFAVACAASLSQVPCTIVRGISNTVGERSSTHWRIPAALRAARELVLQHLSA